MAWKGKSGFADCRRQRLRGGRLGRRAGTASSLRAGRGAPIGVILLPEICANCIRNTRHTGFMAASLLPWSDRGHVGRLSGEAGGRIEGPRLPRQPGLRCRGAGPLRLRMAASFPGALAKPAPKLVDVRRTQPEWQTRPGRRS